MAQVTPFLHFPSTQGRAEADALFGFSLPILPSSIGPDAATRLIDALRTSGFTAWDLRFSAEPQAPRVSILLLCRICRPSHVQPRRFQEHCLRVAEEVQQLYKEFGYPLVPIGDRAALLHALQPFQRPAFAEIRRDERLHLLQDAYTEYELYVPYSWEWTIEKALPLYETLSQQHGACLISMYLEPTHLNSHEQAILHHATQGAVYQFLWRGGAQERAILELYEEMDQRLQQPYLLRISLAAPTPEAVSAMGQHIVRQVRSSGSLPVVQFPQTAAEWEMGVRSLSRLEWVPWGNLRDNADDTGRLRSLVDSQGASKAFYLPVAPGVRTGAVGKIKVLLVFASPAESQRLRLGQEDRVILEALERAMHRDTIMTTVRHAATIHSLARALLEDKFQIVHLAGHGTAAGIILETEAGTGQTVPQEVLAERFAQYYKDERALRCVILNACSSVSLGQLIVQGGVPFSIAMEGAVGDAAAIEFSRGFYDALGAGKEIDAAFREGRFRARAAAPNSSFVPHLFPEIKAR